VYDQATLVREATKSVRDAMLVGALLAEIILFVFLRRARITAISAASIPLTLAITVFVMWLLGQTLNLMTLGAMAIAIGLVIDDAVVVTENIVRHLGLTADRDLAIREAVQELILPVTTSTITTVVVFLPLRLLEGVVGQFFAALSITLTIAVLVSLVLAVTIIPLMAEAFLTTGPTTEAEVAKSALTSVRAGGRGRMQGMLARVGKSIDALSDRYARSLDRALHHTRLMIVGAILLIAGGALAYKLVGTGFLPVIDEGAFVLDYFTPGGTALVETDRQVNIAERILMSMPEVSGISRRTGAELGLFATEQNTGDVVVRLTLSSSRSRSSLEVIDDARTKIESAAPRMRIEFVQILGDVIDDLAGATRPVEIKLFGADLDALEAYAQRLEPQLAKVDGLEDFYNGVSEQSPELMMHINGAEANRVGLTPEQVSGSVSGALLGVQAGEVRLQDRSIAVRVRAPDAVRGDALRLGALPVVIPGTRTTAPLSAMASFEPAETRSAFTRQNLSHIHI
jgi:multidrug efflux pump subunit AcrB